MTNKPQEKREEKTVEDVLCFVYGKNKETIKKTIITQALSQLKELVPVKKYLIDSLPKNGDNLTTDEYLTKAISVKDNVEGYNQAIQDVNEKMFGKEK